MLSYIANRLQAPFARISWTPNRKSNCMFTTQSIGCFRILLLYHRMTNSTRLSTPTHPTKQRSVVEFLSIANRYDLCVHECAHERKSKRNNIYELSKN